MAQHNTPNAAWNAEHDAELEAQDHATADTFAHALGNPTAPSGMHTRLMDSLRHKATAECVQALDAILQTVSLSTTAVPTTPLEVDTFGTLRFARISTSSDSSVEPNLSEDLEIRLQLHEGKLVNRKSLLEYDQHLWSAYTHPSSLAIMLLAADTEHLEVAEGPTVDNGDLVWRIPCSRLGAHWVQYQPRLDCFVAPQRKASLRYAVGQAASAAAEPVMPQEPGEAVLLFSAQEESATDLIIGLEWHPEALERQDAPDFSVFRDRLFGVLEERQIPFRTESEFPLSNRLYICVAPAARQSVEDALAQLNRQLAEY